MFLRTSMGLALAAVATGALAAGPARTPANYTTKALAPNEVSVNDTYVWDANNKVQVAFTNAPDLQGRPYLSFDFLHQAGANNATARFRSQPSTGTTNTGDVTLRTTQGSSVTTQQASSTPDGNGNSGFSTRLLNSWADTELYYVSAQSGYAAMISSPDFYGPNGFIAPDGSGRGVGAWGMTSFRFTDTQASNGSAIVRYSFANSGGESGIIRARLLYADRQGADGYNQLRFYYSNPPVLPVSPN